MFAFILYAIMLALVVFSIGKFKNLRDLLKKMGFRKLSVSGIGMAFFYGAVLLFISIAISYFLSSMGAGEDIGKVQEAVKQSDILLVFAVVVVASFVEEIFFRGYLQRRTNLVFAAAAFGYFHIIYGSLSEVAGTFILGLILGYEFKKVKNLMVPVISHLMYDVFAVILIFGLA